VTPYSLPPSTLEANYGSYRKQTMSDGSELRARAVAAEQRAARLEQELFASTAAMERLAHQLALLSNELENERAAAAVAVHAAREQVQELRQVDSALVHPSLWHAYAQRAQCASCNPISCPHDLEVVLQDRANFLKQAARMRRNSRKRDDNDGGVALRLQLGMSHSAGYRQVHKTREVHPAAGQPDLATSDSMPWPMMHEKDAVAAKSPVAPTGSVFVGLSRTVGARSPVPWRSTVVPSPKSNRVHPLPTAQGEASAGDPPNWQHQSEEGVGDGAGGSAREELLRIAEDDELAASFRGLGPRHGPGAHSSTLRPVGAACTPSEKSVGFEEATREPSGAPSLDRRASGAYLLDQRQCRSDVLPMEDGSAEDAEDAESTEGAVSAELLKQLEHHRGAAQGLDIISSRIVGNMK
jgi:hypothetical protein